MLALRKLLAVGVPAALAVVLAVTPAASSARSFKDPLSDGNRGPDIYNVHVGDDVLNGELVFWVQLANRPQGLLDGELMAVFLDLDKNPSTGDTEGSEYALVMGGVGSGALRWDGSQWVRAEAPSLRAQFVASTLSARVSVAPDELGGATDFGFFIGAFGASGEDVDFAPNQGTWSYAVAPSALALSVSGSVLAPATPVAGKSLSATLRLLRTDTFDPVMAGGVRCTLRVGTRTLRARQSGFAGGAAVCKWTLPRWAKGKRVSAAVAVTYKGATVTKTFNARAR